MERRHKAGECLSCRRREGAAKDLSERFATLRLEAVSLVDLGAKGGVITYSGEYGIELKSTRRPEARQPGATDHLNGRLVAAEHAVVTGEVEEGFGVADIPRI